MVKYIHYILSWVHYLRIDLIVRGASKNIYPLLCGLFKGVFSKRYNYKNRYRFNSLLILNRYAYTKTHADIKRRLQKTIAKRLKNN